MKIHPPIGLCTRGGETGEESGYLSVLEKPEQRAPEQTQAFLLHLLLLAKATKETLFVYNPGSARIFSFLFLQEMLLAALAAAELQEN